MDDTRRRVIEQLASQFERGVERFVRDFSHRDAWERTLQGWLAISVARECPPPLVLAEVQFCKEHLATQLHLCTRIPDTKAFESLLPNRRAAFSFDLCIGIDGSVDVRTWKTKRHETTTYTLDTLAGLAVIAELKTMTSTATKRTDIEVDLYKLLAAVQTAHALGDFSEETLPRLYQIVLLQDRPPNVVSKNKRHLKQVREAMANVSALWPPLVPRPVVLIGGEADAPGTRTLTNLKWDCTD